MRKFKFVGTEQGAEDYDDDDLPVAGRVYLESDEVGGVTVEEWATRSTPTIIKEWEEVFEEATGLVQYTLGGSLQASPDLFEAYLEGVYDAYGGDVEGGNDPTRDVLGLILKKYRGLKGK